MTIFHLLENGKWVIYILLIAGLRLEIKDCSDRISRAHEVSSIKEHSRHSTISVLSV